MRAHKSIQSIWRPTPSGIVVSDGYITDLSDRSSQTFLQLKEKAIEVEKLYAECGVPIPSASDLAGLIADAKALSDAYFMNRTAELDHELLFRVFHLDRVADALLPIRAEETRVHYLSALTDGNLNLLGRRKSRAKDILWELEMWALLRRKSFDAHLKEPPDIVCFFGEARIGIACKKFYSEKHVQNVFSEGVRQIEADSDFGILAANLDDLVPESKILKMPTHSALREFIQQFNASFITAHERHFRKYLAAGRVLSALVSTSMIADIDNAKPRFNNARQHTIWANNVLPKPKHTQLRNFYNRLMA